MASKKLTVGVLRGGPSSEYEVSLETGKNILRHLPADKYRVFDILLTKNGEWNMDGLATTPDKIFKAMDVVFNAMHGEFGEDGQAQRIFEMYNIPHTGSASWPSFLAMNKIMAGESFRENGLQTAEGIVVRKGGDIHKTAIKIIQKIGPPWIIKPSSKGSSIGIYTAHDYDGLVNKIDKAFEHGNLLLIEKLINGREATCAVLENFRGADHYAFPVVEIVKPKDSDFFDYQVKYNGSTEKVCPGRFDFKTKAIIQETTVKAHKALGCSGYSRSDFMIDRNGIYLLETNTLPGLTHECSFPKAASTVGLEFPQLLEHIIKLALERR